MEKYPNFNILINVPQPYLPKAEFVLRTYCYILRLNPKFFYGSHSEGIHLYYGPYSNFNYPLRIYFDPATAEFFEQRELYPLDKVNFRKYRQEAIPFLFSLSGELYTFFEDFCVIRKDIIASGFYFLSCWHEYVASRQGQGTGRVDFRESLQYRWDFTELPVVDVYCRILYRTLKLLMPEFVRDIHWSEKKAFSMSLSHDVDYWHYWTQEQIRKSYQYNLTTFYKRPLVAFYKMLGHLQHIGFLNNPWRKIRKILTKEDGLQVQSTWFLMASTDYPDQRQNYISNVKYSEQILDLLSQRDIGLHGSPEAAFDLAVLKKELQALQYMGFSPAGFRTHYLHFDYQKSFSVLEQAGVKYDSTLGYWEHIGYRAGISFPFYPYNIEENRTFRVLEIPLIVMDTTMYSRKAMNLNPLSAYGRLRGLMKRAANYQSHISLLWHNTTYDFIEYPFWGLLYWRMIRKAKKQNGWITSLSHIYDEWVNLSY